MTAFAIPKASRMVALFAIARYAPEFCLVCLEGSFHIFYSRCIVLIVRGSYAASHKYIFCFFECCSDLIAVKAGYIGVFLAL